MNEKLTKTESVFHSVVNSAVGSTRQCNDGSCSDCFNLSENNVLDLTRNLSDWWDDTVDQGNDEELTGAVAKQYFESLYPRALIPDSF